MGVYQDFQNFCRETTLHGWSHVVNAEKIYNKIFWALFLLGSNIFVTYFVGIYTAEFLNSGTIPVVETTTGSIKEIEFPTVWICNINQLQGSFFKKMGIYDDEESFDIFKGEFIDGRTEKLSASDAIRLENIKDKMIKHHSWNESETVRGLAAQPCSDMIIKAIVGKKKYLFNPLVYQAISDIGICCWLSIQALFGVTRENTNSFVRNGVHLLLDVEMHEYFDPQLGSNGWRIGTSFKSEKGIVNFEQLNIESGKEILIEVTPSISNISKSALSRFNPTQRNCFTEDEFYSIYFPKVYYPFYSQYNCLYGAAVEKVYSNCNCSSDLVAGFVQRSIGIHKRCYGEAKACENEQIWSVLENPADVMAKGEDGELVKCLPECTKQHYNLKVSSQGYPTWQTFIKREDICHTFQKLMRICQENHRAAVFEEHNRSIIKCKDIKRVDAEGICKTGKIDVKKNLRIAKALFNYANKNLAHLKIYIKNPFYTLTTKDVQISTGSFIGNLGGLFGMMLGLSAFGALELLAFLLESFIMFFKSLHPSFKCKV